MDKRIIWFALIVIMAIAAIFIFRKVSNKPVAPVTSGASITPDFTISPGVIQEGDSIHYEDHTIGATSWQWDFSDGGTSTQQSGYITYYASGVFTIKLIINDSIIDSKVVEVRAKGVDVTGPTQLPAIIVGPKTAYVGEQLTFTDNTPGAEHTTWVNLLTYERKKDSKTYITSFAHKGIFKITATNEKNKGQGSITVKVIEKTISNPDTTRKIIPPPVKTHLSDADLRKLFSRIVTGKEEDFPQNYKPIKDAIQDEHIPVTVKGGSLTGGSLYRFCQYLNFTHPNIEDVKSDWDAVNGFKSITVTVKENN